MGKIIFNIVIVIKVLVGFDMNRVLDREPKHHDQ